MAAFSSNESRCMDQILDISKCDNRKPVEEAFEIDKCVKWIQDNGFQRVCLQFPDDMLCDSADVAITIQSRTDCQPYVLGDSSYGSCCVDEVSAEHVNGDAIIHFGHACMSPTQRLPVLYIFPVRPIDPDHFISSFQQVICDTSSNVQLIFDVAYDHASRKSRRAPKLQHTVHMRGKVHIENSIYEHLASIYPNLQLARPAFESDRLQSDEILRLGRRITVTQGKSVTDYSVAFIGKDGRTLSNFLLEVPGCQFYHYDPSEPEVGVRCINHLDSKFLMKRYYLVERVKDASTLGILIGTLGVTNYMQAVERVRKLAKARGKRVYVIAVGRPNVPKLANFPEIDVFVHVACPESTLLDSRDFYQPIVSLYEVEVACNPNTELASGFIIDFRRMLEGADTMVGDAAADDESATDVSLVTGKIRSLQTDDEPILDQNDTTLAERPSLTVSLGSGSDFLANRSWRGLEPKLGEVPVALAAQGRSGIAFGYEDEGKETEN